MATTRSARCEQAPVVEEPASGSNRSSVSNGSSGSRGRGRTRRRNSAGVRRGTGVISAKRAKDWNRKFGEARRWVSTTGRYPQPGSSDEVEKALRNFLYDNLPKQCSFRPERWDKLNKAFGAGWEYVFCPGFGTGRNGPPKGYITAKRALLWATMLADTEGWVKENGRFPGRCASDTEERALADWLYNNLPGRQGFRPERWEMLNDAFGEEWEKVFFPGFGGGRSPKGITPTNAAKWNSKFAKVKGWKSEMGVYPDPQSSDREERLLGKWLYDNLSGRATFQPERWDSLNEAFGKEWEYAFCPGFGSRK